MELSVPHLNERVSAAPGVSPGVVEDSETLLREIFFPYHVQGGSLQLAAVSLRELRKTGFSVHRKKHVTFELVENSIKMRLSRPRKGIAWKIEGLAEILSLDVRKITGFDNKSLFVIIDTALEDNPGHASIYAAHPEKGDAYARKIRFHLMELLTNVKTLEIIFQQ
ncbi:MAG: hypothetical protein OXF20_09215 [Gammaproteobacteria bacterium]|nr:hypothetical protein [Gammaproteobacteria bacterium]